MKNPCIDGRIMNQPAAGANTWTFLRSTPLSRCVRPRELDFGVVNIIAMANDLPFPKISSGRDSRAPTESSLYDC